MNLNSHYKEYMIGIPRGFSTEKLREEVYASGLVSSIRIEHRETDDLISVIINNDDRSYISWSKVYHLIEEHIKQRRQEE